MAVVQISKLQVRRGIKSQTGLPQLAAGEFGWAVDSQQLFIGNGAVAEGAPYVGNTEVLTEKSNIFALLPNYSFKGYGSSNSSTSTPYYGAPNLVTSTTATGITSRTLQSKLDDFSSVRDFGALGNGTQDDTAAIQLAIDQLFLNSDKTNTLSRRVLYMPAGTYKITNTLYWPSNTTIVGEGRNNTIILMSANNHPIFQTKANDTSAGATPNLLATMNSSNQPTNIRVVGISFQRSTGLTANINIGNLDCVNFGLFEDCEFASVYNAGQGIETGPVTVGSHNAIQIRGNGAVTTRYVHFSKCIFKNVTHAVYSDYNSSDITFDYCYFTTCFRAFTLALASNSSNTAQTTGPQYYTVSNSVFDVIDAEAIRVYGTNNRLSRGHKSVSNRYYDVGNSHGGITSSYLPAIVFASKDCESLNDYFARSRQIDNDFKSQVAYIPDVVGLAEIKYNTKSLTLISNVLPSQARVLLETPLAGSSTIIVEYTMTKTSKNLYRSGSITITTNKSMSDNASPTSPVMSEKFVSTTGDDGNVRFYVSATNYQIANNNTVRTTGPTLILTYSNSDGPGNDAVINYTTRIISDLDSTYV